MRRLLYLALVYLLTAPAWAATYYVDADSNYVTSVTWGSGGLPAQPTYAWWLGNGTDYDTVGGATPIFRNYGATPLTTGLGIGTLGSLIEGFASPGQAAINFNGTADFLVINDATVLRPGTADFGILLWARWTVSDGDRFIAKYSFNALGREWQIYTLAGPFVVSLSATGNIEGMRYTSVTSYNDGLWHFIGFTWVSDVLTLYADGAVATVTQDVPGPITEIFQSTTLAAIGSVISGGLPANWFTGDIGPVAYWQGATTPTTAQIAALYTAMRPTGVITKPYPSLQGALTLAAAGDTLLLGSGIYNETVEIATAFGNEDGAILGITHTTGNLPIFYGGALPAAAGVIGMTVSARCEIGWMTFRGWTGTGGIGLKADATSDGSLLHHIEMDSCLTGIVFEGACDNDSLINSTIDCADIASSRGIQAALNFARTMVILNNIITRCASIGIDETYGTFAGGYNDLYGNLVNYFFMSALTGDVTFNPRFVSQATNDYSLQHSSRLNNVGTVVHNAQFSFAYLQSAPAIGVWETTFGVPRGTAIAWGRQPWARGAWGGSTWGR